MWVLLAGEALAAVLALAPGITQDRLIYFGLASLVIQWIALATLGMLYLLRHRIALLRPPRIAYVALGLLLLCTWLAAGLALQLWQLGFEGPTGEWMLPALRLTGVSLMVGLLGLAIFQNHWRARQAAVRAKHAELESLQARTHPHFLFNTLNTAIALLHVRPAEAERVLLDLADLFRAALAGPRHIPLTDELSLTRRYLNVEELRLGNRLAVYWELPVSIPDAEVPALSIQPLVENAVRHGVELRFGGGRIDIQVTISGDWLNVTVRNDLADRRAENDGHGVGIPSVACRVEAMSRGRGSLQTGVIDGRYVATIRLPVTSPAT